jgi:hypothetical protein
MTDITRLCAVAVNRKGKFFRLDDDTKLPFIEMLDASGKKTLNPDDCIIALYQLPNGMFSGVDLRLFGHDQQETTQ